MMGAMETPDDTCDANFDAELSSYLASCEGSGSYCVLERLKSSDFEVTEKVVFAGEKGGLLGPFVRKRIDASCGLGTAYGQLLAAQRAGLRCANLPRVFDCWNDGRQLNVVMEWLPGRTLEELVREEGPSAALARDAAGQLCRAVSLLHDGLGGQAPIIHRDLKPSNVMVVGGSKGYGAPGGSDASDSSGGADVIPATYVLIDLGIARTWHEGATTDTQRLGTRSYAPPEQFGFGQTGVRSDVYALGAILYFCLTGEDPTAGVSPEALVVRPDIPPELGAVVAKAMSFDPDDRYESVEELACALGGESCGAALRASRLRVPVGVGRAWNVALAVALALLVAACVGNFVVPAPSSAGYPTWFLALEYLLWLPLSFAALAYLLADKRRLLTRVPGLARISLGRQRAICIGTIVATLVVTLAAGMAAGVL